MAACRWLSAHEIPGAGADVSPACHPLQHPRTPQLSGRPASSPKDRTVGLFHPPATAAVSAPCTTLLREDRRRLGGRKSKLSALFFVLLSPCTTLLRQDWRRLGRRKSKLSALFFVLLSPCTTLLRQDRRRLGRRKTNLSALFFVLLSPCTIFADTLTSAPKKTNE